MGKYKSYPEYKDSGVEWLGEIPGHWVLNKLRYLFTFGKGLTITKENLTDEGIPCVNYGEVHSKYGFEVNPLKKPLKCVDLNYLQTSPNSLLQNGDFVFADTSEDLKGSGNFTHLVSEEKVFAGYHTIIARPYNRGASRFYAYLFDSQEFRSQIQLAVKGVKVFSITQAILRAATIWLPSESEQQGIAYFLDHETAKIDHLIEKQQQLIELLKEKRQAVISHAVTKGLDPNVPMKDSGVQWLGEVPAHWSVTKIGFHALKIGSGKTPKGGAEIYQENGVLFLRSQNIYNDGLKVGKSESVFISEQIHEEMATTHVFSGDILLNITGGSIGRSCLIPENFCAANVNQHVCIIRVPKKIQEYLSFVMVSNLIQDQINLMQTGGNREGLNFEQIAKFTFCLPSDAELEHIIKTIKNKLSKLNDLEKYAYNAIQFMQERRTALISAAVTGKIDVRNWQAPNQEAQKELCA